MLYLTLIGFILWILYLLWRISTKPFMIPVKDYKMPSDGCPPSAKEDPSTAQCPPPGEHSLPAVASTSEQNEAPRPQTESTSGDITVETLAVEALQAPSAARPSGTCAPKLSSGPDARERLKFILGASEDNSSDDEPVVAKPPSSALQPRTSNQISSPQQDSCAQADPHSSTIK